jgi:hypothetical protein
VSSTLPPRSLSRFCGTVTDLMVMAIRLCPPSSCSSYLCPRHAGSSNALAAPIAKKCRADDPTLVAEYHELGMIDEYVAQTLERW